MKKKVVLLSIILIIVIIVGLWIRGIIPKVIARISSEIYFKKNYPNIIMEYKGIEWNSAFGDYIISFDQFDKDGNFEKERTFVIGPKYFPISIGQGENALKEEYNKEPSLDQKLDLIYNNTITKQYKDIRKLDKDYTAMDARKDNCFVVTTMVENNHLYKEFMNKYNKKESAFIRVAQTTVEGDLIIADLLYDSEKRKVSLVKDDTRDEFSSGEDRIIWTNDYEKIGIWEYGKTKYWVVYNGELPQGDTEEYTFNKDLIYIITEIN